MIFILLVSLSLPIGTVVSTLGKCAPGWIEADGSNKTPDLRGKICGMNGICIAVRHCVRVEK